MIKQSKTSVPHFKGGGNLYDKVAITGHRNVEQTAVYDRKTVVVPVVGGQKKGV